MTLAGSGTTAYSDTKALSGIFNNDSISNTVGLLDPNEGDGSLAQRSWQAVFNLFDGFCGQTRKDCMFIADCLRHQLVLGKNQKVLSDKSKNFSQHVYTPFKNLVSKSNSNYSAIFAQWAQVYDTASGDFAWVPFSGFQGAIMARLDASRYPWFAPAGLENGIVRGVTDIALPSTQKQRDLLYRHSVNAVVFFPNDGIVTWGQKTLQKKPSAFDRINVRRLFLTLEKGTRSVMKYFVFQPNTVFTRTRVKNVLTPIFDVPKNNEGLYDYLIVCDERNNTPSVIDNNELKVAIYLKPVRTAEFILVDFYATRTDQNFSELI
jgi:phage tail sheath protein FI